MELHYQPDYVLDKMEMWELKTAFQYEHYAYKNNWEIARFEISPHVKSTEKIEFPWEKKVEQHNTTVTSSDRKRLEEKAKLFNMNKNGK